MKSKAELEKIAEDALRNLPKDLSTSELGYVLSCMLRIFYALENRWR